jgi:hypothetical protein
MWIRNLVYVCKEEEVGSKTAEMKFLRTVQEQEILTLRKNGIFYL